MKQIQILLLALILISISACELFQGKYDKIYGQTYYSLREFKPFVHFHAGGGADIGPLGNSTYTVSDYYDKDNEIVALERLVDTKGSRMKFCLLDILEVPKLKKNQYLDFGNGMLNQKPDPEIISIIEVTNPDVLTYTNVIKAWRANRKTGKFEEMDTKGIVVNNEGED